jgi:glutathione S-transferase
MKLIIGNKNYSSWSLRPWLLLKHNDINFDEIMIPLYQDNTKAELLKYSPAGKVPTLIHQGQSIWDSLAICEFIAELYPDAKAWPINPQDRALARSISHEMHSGFMTIRNSLPMNCRKSMIFNVDSTQLQQEIDRIAEIWQSCRNNYSSVGPFLFGEFSIADAMYAPIVLRFQSYGIKVGTIQSEYMQTILSLPAIKDWISDGLLETEIIEVCEVE